MIDINASIAISRSGIALTLQRLFWDLKCRNQLRRVILDALMNHLLMHECEETDLRTSASDLQIAADRFRLRHRLTTADQMHQWLAQEHLTLEDFEAGLERELLVEKFKDHLVTQKGAEHFAANRDRYAQAQLRQIVAASEGVARELLARIYDEGRDFGELAREHSLHNSSRLAGGSLGLVPRHTLPEAAAQTIFSGKIGSVVGPVATRHGFHLFLIEALPEPTLDEVTAAAIREELFADWVKEQLRDVQIDLSWLKSSE